MVQPPALGVRPREAVAASSSGEAGAEEGAVEADSSVVDTEFEEAGASFVLFGASEAEDC
jgi:hypothetical protein